MILVTGGTGTVGRQVAANTLMWADQIRFTDVVHWPYGAAARSLIHESDLAAVAVRCLTGDGHAGARYLLTGPAAVSQIEQVAAIGAAVGRPLRWQELTREDIRPGLVAAFGDEESADGALDAWAAFLDAPEPVTDVVQQVTGSPALSFRIWAQDHADDFA